jgi:hypothetical protein
MENVYIAQRFARYGYGFPLNGICRFAHEIVTHPTARAELRGFLS